MVLSTCPDWCTAHDDAAWDSSTHGGDPVTFRIRDPHQNTAELSVALTGIDGAPPFLEIAAVDAGFRTVLVDLDGAVALAEAILLLVCPGTVATSRGAAAHM